MAPSTSDGARPNVDYRKSKLIHANRTDSKQTHKNITLSFELAADEVVDVEVWDEVHQVLEPMLVQVFGPDVGRVVVRWDVVNWNLSLRHQLSDEEETERDVFRPRAEGPVSQCMRSRRVVAVRRYLGKLLPEP